MRIDCYFTHQSCTEDHFSGRTAVVIDVLRATSSIIAALEAGAAAIIPIARVADALALHQQMPNALLAGEREGQRLESFDLGNSPLEFNREAVAGRTIIACTTNGTSAIVKASAAEQVWLAALTNAQAVAEKALHENVAKLAILCSGTDGEPSLDDTMAAGAILYHLSKGITLNSQDLNDSAVMALRIYESYADMDMYQVLTLAYHGQRMLYFKRGHDVHYCAQQNISATVPWLDKASGRIYGS